MKKTKRKFFLFLLLLLALPALILVVKKVAEIRGRADWVGTAANIIVDTAISEGPLPPFWQSLAQGGEETEPMLDDVIPEIRTLGTKYIRLDHIYDFGDFSYLDKRVQEILNAGAKPMLALSYFPSSVSPKVIDGPVDWLAWQNLVKQTIERYSGLKGQHIEGVYYEVWNEPDSFGSFTMPNNQFSSQNCGPYSKDYRCLYYFSAQAALQAKNTSAFFRFGGPAITKMDKEFAIRFLSFIDSQNLPLDFFSWHRYDLRPEKFGQDIEELNDYLSIYPKFNNLEKILTEWGHEAKNDSGYDNQFAAIHTLATATYLANGVSQAYAFEIKDGPSPENKKFWGRWGLLTHEKFNKEKKPRYYALSFLNRLGSEKIKIEGEGSWVRGIATREEKKYSLFLTNFDSQNSHLETVPITFLNVSTGVYRLTQTFFDGRTLEEEKISLTKDLITQIMLGSNQAVFLVVEKIREAEEYSVGRFGYNGDRSLVINGNTPEINLNFGTGMVEFWFQPNWENSDIEEKVFFQGLRFGGKKIKAIKRLAGFGQQIEFGFYDLADRPIEIVSAPADLLKKGQWTHFAFALDDQNLTLYINEQQFIKPLTNKLPLGTGIVFGNFLGQIDDLRLSSVVRNLRASPFAQPYQLDSETTILTNFDERL